VTAPALPLDATDYVEAALSLYVDATVGCCGSGVPLADVRATVDASSYFTCTYASAAFGNFTKEATPGAARSLLLKFRTPLEQPQLDALLADKKGRVEITQPDGRRFTGWLEELRHQAAPNLADITLVTTPDLIPHPPAL
jgi:hypothetical protein